MSSTQLVLEKTVTVSRPPEVAFRVFTEAMAGWWPAATHSVGGPAVETVVFEPGVGGRIFERLGDGTEHAWGEVTEWVPPERLAFTWYPGRGPESGQLVQVRFLPEGDGTRVELVQRGWETLGDEAGATFASYDGESGWSRVLADFAAAAAGAA
jgi:uncharacterized protein YndB with AHSA1/START domain